MSYEKFQKQILEVAYRQEIGLGQVAMKKNQNGVKNDPMSIESRNHRLTRKQESK